MRAKTGKVNTTYSSTTNTVFRNVLTDVLTFLISTKRTKTGKANTNYSSPTNIVF